MTASIDFDRRVATWLGAAGPQALEDEVVTAALATARRLPMRRGLRALVTGPADWPGRRPSVRLVPVRLRLAGLVVLSVGMLVAVATVGSRMLERTPVVPLPSTPTDVSPSVSLVPSPTAATGPSHAPTPDSLAHGRYTPAPDLLTPLFGPQTVRLLDGRVLIYGPTLARATDGELFDPRSGEAVHLDLPPDIGSTALLPDGRVLMIGGSPEPTKPGPSVLFDPETLAVEATAPQRIPRSGAHLVALQDGRVLMLGGEPPHPDGDEQWTISRAELFDPSTSTWSLTGSLHSKRFSGSEAVALPDGRVLAATSTVPNGLPVNVSGGGHTQYELFDPADGTWTVALTLERGSPHANALPQFALPDGRVGFVKTVEQYAPSELSTWDPRTKGWSDPVTLPGAVAHEVVLDDGRVYLLGALDAFTTWSAIFDPETHEIVGTGPTRAWGANPVLLADGRILIVGGNTDGDMVATMGPDHRIPPAVATMEYFQ
jgi:hypothetical protein